MSAPGFSYGSLIRWMRTPWGLALLLLLALTIVHETRRARALVGQGPISTLADAQQIILGADGRPYVDPTGRFSLVPPAGWTQQVRTGDEIYDVTFVGPLQANLNILASPVAYDDLNVLYDDIRRREKEYGISTIHDVTRFQDHPAVRRTAQMPSHRIVSYDFLDHRVAYHILYEIPNSASNEYEIAIEEVLKTFKTGGAGESGS